jgi:hypothetical protein
MTDVTSPPPRARAERHGLVLDQTESEVMDLIGGAWSRARYLETGTFKEPTVHGLRRTASAVKIWATHQFKADGRYKIVMPPKKNLMD